MNKTNWLPRWWNWMRTSPRLSNKSSELKSIILKLNWRIAHLIHPTSQASTMILLHLWRITIAICPKMIRKLQSDHNKIIQKVRIKWNVRESNIQCINNQKAWINVGWTTLIQLGIYSRCLKFSTPISMIRSMHMGLRIMVRILRTAKISKTYSRKCCQSLLLLHNQLGLNINSYMSSRMPSTRARMKSWHFHEARLKQRGREAQIETRFKKGSIELNN